MTVVKMKWREHMNGAWGTEDRKIFFLPVLASFFLLLAMKWMKWGSHIRCSYLSDILKRWIFFPIKISVMRCWAQVRSWVNTCWCCTLKCRYPWARASWGWLALLQKFHADHWRHYGSGVNWIHQPPVDLGWLSSFDASELNVINITGLVSRMKKTLM